MRRARLRFDKATASFFETFYLVLKYSWFFILLFAPFMFRQRDRLAKRKRLGDTSVSFSSVCEFVPCFVLYSKMDNNVQGIYTWSLLLFIFVGLIAFGRKYTVFA